MSLLEVEDLSIRFGGILALDSVCFTVEQGEILSIIGPNGAGKTTVFNCISRIYDPPERIDRVYGSGPAANAASPDNRQGVARTFQNLELFSTMSVLENLLVGQHWDIRYNLLDAVFSLPRALRQERTARSRAGEVLDLLTLTDFCDTPVQSLAYDVKKRVELGRALVSRPRLVLLDEPASGLTNQEVSALADIIRTIRDDLGVTVLLVEHRMNLVMNVSDRVCVLDFGQKIAEGTPDQVRRDPSVIRTYLGTSSAED